MLTHLCILKKLLLLFAPFNLLIVLYINIDKKTKKVKYLVKYCELISLML